MIHSTAIIHPKAKVDPTVDVGPYSIIDENVSVGPGCKIGPYVYLTGHTTIGANNRFFCGCVIGEAPQDIKYKDEPTGVRIGDNNLFREGVTVHRSNKMSEDTVIGSNNFLMANTHVGHNATLANHIVMANGALLAGHVQIEDRVFISGNCLVHQFVRIGTLALIQGGSAASQDVPPYTIARGVNQICGLNIVGLRRAGLKPDERLELKKLYHALFRKHQNLTAALAVARSQFTSPHARVMLDFIIPSKRGVCRDSGGIAGKTAGSQPDID